MPKTTKDEVKSFFVTNTPLVRPTLINMDEKSLIPLITIKMHD